MITRDKSNVLIISSITISTVLLTSISILLSSFRGYLINNVKKEIGDYHVIIKSNYIKDNSILNNNYKNERNYIKYKEINRVYKNTNNICQKEKCETITYNDSLLSLYGLSKSKNTLKVFKSFLYFFIIFFGTIIFFILYNSFSITISIKKKNIILYKLAGSDNNYLLKLNFKQTIIMTLFSIMLGFIISYFLNIIIIKIINRLLYEIFIGQIKINIYYSFLLIPIIVIFIIILLCSIIPFKEIKKYKVLELFRKNNEPIKNEIRLKRNIIFYLFKINIYRFKNKYKNLIICIFIFCYSFNAIFITLDYGLKCIQKSVIIPKYDLKLITKTNYNYKNIIKKLKPIKKLEFHSCQVKVNIPKNYYHKYEKTNTTITDIGKNEVINNIEIIGKKNKKITHLKYKRFKYFKEITIDDYTINNLKLTNKKYFGIDGKDTIINLDKDTFNKICPEYDSNLIVKTNYKGIDKYLNSQIKKEKININYLNIKKTNEIINNIILVIKILLYSSSLLVFLTLLLLSINISIFSIYKRKKEIATLRSLGLTHKELTLTLLLESLYISVKGFMISVPFIFTTNKYIYKSITELFEFGKIIINFKILLTSFLLIFCLVFMSNYVSYIIISKKSLINNIKYEY